jgi:hypothetical protein
MVATSRARPTRTSSAARSIFLISLDTHRRGGLWRLDGADDEPELVSAAALSALGAKPATILLLQEWVDTAACDETFPRAVLSTEHYDEVGLRLWAHFASELPDRVEVGYQSVAGLGRLWELPSPAWVATRRARVRARWRQGPVPKPW